MIDALFTDIESAIKKCGSLPRVKKGNQNMGEFTIFLLKALAFVLVAGVGCLLSLYTVVWVASWLQELKHNVKRLARKKAQQDVAKKAEAEQEKVVKDTSPKKQAQSESSVDDPLSRLSIAELRKLLEEGSAVEAAAAAKLLEARRKLLYQLKRFDAASEEKPTPQRKARPEASLATTNQKREGASNVPLEAPDQNDIPFDPPYVNH